MNANPLGPNPTCVAWTESAGELCCRTIIGGGLFSLMGSKVVAKFFPTPIALHASLRFLAERVSSLFGLVIPYSLPIWTAVSVVDLITSCGCLALLAGPAAVWGEGRECCLNECLHLLASSIAWVANAILLVTRTNFAFLANTATNTGQFSLWKRLFLDLRNAAFVGGFCAVIKNFYNEPLPVVRNLLNIGVVALSAYSGYTTAIGAMATISCLLGSVQLFDKQHLGELFWFS
jgi:hypothetical protein